MQTEEIQRWSDKLSQDSTAHIVNKEIIPHEFSLIYGLVQSGFETSSSRSQNLSGDAHEL